MVSEPLPIGRYERFALVLDPERTRLGTDSLVLVQSGIDPLYAATPREAVLLARQERHRLGALVVAGSLPLSVLDVVVEQVAPELWAGPGAVVVVAPPRDRAFLRALADRGIRWVLREPYDDDELRFVVSAAFAAEDRLDPRSGLRVPIVLPAHLEQGERRLAGRIRNISMGGAYFALPDPEVLAEGEGLVLEFTISDRTLRLDVAVVYRQRAAASGRAVAEPGVGLRVRSLDGADVQLVAGFVGDRVGGFRL
jgi:hypothetical protein